LVPQQSIDANADLDIAFALRTLHHASVGLSQLHRVNVAHQDLKPSNVLVFRGAGSKVGDLGRAWAKDMPAPHDEAKPCAGDLTYAPPELLYQQISSDDRVRRFACDMYQLGSLAVFIFTRAHMNALLFSHIAPVHNHNAWGGTYADVLPYVQAAFAETMAEFKGRLPDRMKSGRLEDELVLVVSQLCEPDPSKRGHPHCRQGAGNQYSLERYISIFNRLAFTAEIQLRTKVA